MAKNKKSGATLLNAVTMVVVVLIVLILTATIVGAVVSAGMR